MINKPAKHELIYQIVSKVLSWMVLHAPSDTANEIEILVPATNRPRSTGAHHGRG